MSKYQKRGAYHYAEFEQDTPYRKHVLDLVEQVKEIVKPHGLILDVGCGEGLIMAKLNDVGFTVRGCEIDDKAIELGREKGHDIVKGGIEHYDTHPESGFHAVLLCDVLEHVKDFKATVAKAQRLADVVVIAIPDRPDRHATYQPSPGDIDDLFPLEEWDLEIDTQRHARFLMIYQRDSSS